MQLHDFSDTHVAVLERKGYGASFEILTFHDCFHSPMYARNGTERYDATRDPQTQIGTGHGSKFLVKQLPSEDATKTFHEVRDRLVATAERERGGGKKRTAEETDISKLSVSTEIK